GKGRLARGRARHDVVYSREALIANMLSVLDRAPARRGSGPSSRRGCAGSCPLVRSRDGDLRARARAAAGRRPRNHLHSLVGDRAAAARRGAGGAQRAPGAAPLAAPAAVGPCLRRSPFGPLHYERADDEQTVDVEGLLTLYSTRSSFASLSRDERAALFARVRPLLAGPYRLPLRHELAWTRLAR